MLPSAWKLHLGDDVHCQVERHGQAYIPENTSRHDPIRFVSLALCSNYVHACETAKRSTESVKQRELFVTLQFHSAKQALIRLIQQPHLPLFLIHNFAQRDATLLFNLLPVTPNMHALVFVERVLEVVHTARMRFGRRDPADSKGRRGVPVQLACPGRFFDRAGEGFHARLGMNSGCGSLLGWVAGRDLRNLGMQRFCSRKRQG